MSFLRQNETIHIGDRIALYSGFNKIQHLKIEAGKTHQTKFGALRHNDLIGRKYGSKAPCSKGWMYALRITPELWTITLPHRTQILYSTDISMITMQLDLKPGSIVVEAGTGSGSLSHALIRTVAPTGHLHTFDFHEERSDKATEEFKDHGLSHVVTAKHRDVCADGFGLENIADAIFLDLPSPWEVLRHAKAAITKRGGRICSFSPCIEQVKRTCEGMRELGLKDINTMECLVRDYNIHTITMPMPIMTLDGKPPVVEDLAGDEPPVGRQIKQHDVERAKDGNQRKRKLPNHGVSDQEVYQFKSAVSRYMMPGHTGYLTFATIYK